MSAGRLRGLLAELRRRRVFRVAVGYAAAGFLVLQAAELLIEPLRLPAWSMPLVLALVLLGFPVALVMAWAFDITPAGVRRTPVLSPVDLRKVADLTAMAIDLGPGERTAFLDRVAAGQPRLRREVESLLSAHAARGLLDSSAAELMEVLAPAGGPSARTGHSISHYRILERLGEGGMGVVYKASDTRLRRVVALKFLPPALNENPSAKQRFLIEAQTAAALDHPNLCTIHEVGETEDGQLFIAMPFYDGETLKQRIARGPLPLSDSIDITRQAARGLAKAHESGIIHRDIKPANLMLTASGVVKVLDFGVAKAADVNLTRPGGRPGTAAYMSPEQARGEAVDARTDVWSLAAVLYEMLSGQRPFGGEWEEDVMSALQRARPQPLASLVRGLPPAIEAVLGRALSKSRESRYSSTLEFAADLERAATGGPPPPRAAGATGAAAEARPETDASSSGVLPEGERRQAAVLAAGISGYAELVDRLAPESLERVLDRLRGIVEEVARANECEVERFTGEDFLLLFGIPVTHEDDPVRAVRAALVLRRRLAEVESEVALGGEPHLRLALHVGIDAGPVTARPKTDANGGYRIGGAVAQNATTLSSLAPAGEIWVTPETQRTVAAFFEFVTAPPIRMRGRERPLVPHRVDRETGLETRLEAREKGGLTTFVGRQQELATLQLRLAEALAGEGRFVTVIGEPGLGKSRLLHEFRQSTTTGGVVLLQGRCQSYGGGTAYLPFVGMLREALGASDGGGDEAHDDIGARIRRLSTELDEFIPLYLHLLSVPLEDSPLARYGHGEQFRMAIQDALAAFFTVQARQRPVAMVLEDWHWADEASHGVLRQLAEITSGFSMLLIVTSRPVQAIDWGNAAHHTVLTLEPMDATGSLDLARSALRARTVPAGLGRMIHERSGGNPFFIEEICHSLIEDGTVRVEAGQAQLAGSIDAISLPDTVQAVIRARLDRLERDPREVLRIASVIGREFSRPLLERCCADPERLSASLEAAKRAGLIRQTHVVPEPAYRFKHVLTQEAAYASLLEHQRRDLHGRVGTAIEELHRDRLEEYLDRLAHHFSRAEDWPRAIRYGIRAADRTSALSQFVDALHALERVQRWLARLPAGEEHRQRLIAILLRQERLCETLGLRGRQQHIVDELIALLEPTSDEDQLAEVYLRQGDLFTLLRRFGEAERPLMRSLELRRKRHDREGERNTLRSLGLLRWHGGRPRDAIPFIEQSLEIDRERRDMLATVTDLSNYGAVLKSMGSLDQARERLEEALALTESVPGDDVAVRSGETFLKQTYILHNLANIHRELGDEQRALEYYARCRRLTEDKRLPIQLSYHLTSVAHILLQQGKVDESIERYREAVELTRRARFVPGLAQSLRMLGELLLGIGRPEESLPLLEEAAALFSQLKDGPTEAAMWVRVASVHERAERWTEALTAWGKARTLQREAGDRRGEMEALEAIGRACGRQLPEPSIALEYYRQALELACSLRDPEAEGRLRNALGIMEWRRGDYSAALTHYRTALGIFRELGREQESGLMLNSIGVTLQAIGDGERARETLESALEHHRGCGLRLLEAHALAALGDLCAEGGESDRAIELFEQSLRLRRELRDRRGEGWMLQRLAASHRASGAAARGKELARESARIAAECGDHEMAEACEALQR